MPLHVKSENVPERKGIRTGSQGEGSMISRKGYGNESSLMIAARAPGYHTRPHVHESEQINYVLEGEIWFFVEDKAFHCQQGDFQRIPANNLERALPQAPCAEGIFGQSQSVQRSRTAGKVGPSGLDRPAL